jgi:hypothetical protein
MQLRPRFRQQAPVLDLVGFVLIRPAKRSLPEKPPPGMFTCTWGWWIEHRPRAPHKNAPHRQRSQWLLVRRLANDNTLKLKINWHYIS